MPIYSTISAKAIPTPQRPNISFYPLEKSSSDPVRTKEQVTQRAAQQIGDSFWPILWKSLRLALQLSEPFKALVNGLRMQAYGHWLRREAQRGRFHYLPVEEVAGRLEALGFVAIQYRRSYADQAYLVQARRGGDQPHADRGIAA